MGAFRAALLSLVVAGGCMHTTVVETTPPGAKVFVGDELEAEGVTPHELVELPGLDSGSYLLRVESDDQVVFVEVSRGAGPRFEGILNLALAAGAASLCTFGCTGVWAALSVVTLAVSPWLQPIMLPIVALTWLGCFGCGCLSCPKAWGGLSPDEIHVDLESGAVKTRGEGAATSRPGVLPAPLPPPPGDEQQQPGIVAMAF